MSYSTRQIANYFIHKARVDQAEINPLKLMKIVYIAHGYSLAINDKPLIKEGIKARMYGPVISSLYKSLVRYGNNPITADIPDTRAKIGK